jgi:translation initiation factor IF-1
MVKNTNGGNREKRNARKDAAFKDHKSYRAVRRPEDPNEMLAVVTNRYGGKNLGVTATDKKTYRAIIPGAMTGRRRRGNEVRVGSIILIGIWDGFGEGKSTVLEVYDDNEVAELQRIPGMGIPYLKTQVEGAVQESHDDCVDFYEGATEIPVEDTVRPQRLPGQDLPSAAAAEEEDRGMNSWIDDI